MIVQAPPYEDHEQWMHSECSLRSCSVLAAWYMSVVLGSFRALHMSMDQLLKLQNLTELATSTSPTTYPLQVSRSRTPPRRPAFACNNIGKALNLSALHMHPVGLLTPCLKTSKTDRLTQLDTPPYNGSLQHHRVYRPTPSSPP